MFSIQYFLVYFLTGFVFFSSQPKLLANKNITISAVGDIVPGTNFGRNALPPGDGSILFEQVKQYFDKKRLIFGNFESAMTNYTKTRKNTNRKLVFAFRTPPRYAQTLKNIGFDILNIANNHAFDFYEQGFRDSYRYLESAGIHVVGKKNQIKYLEYNGSKIAFIGFGYTHQFNSIHSLSHGVSLVKQATKKTNIVIISVHAGAEGSKAIHVRNENEIFYGENRGNLVKFSHRMIDAGADLILGHGPHVPRALEMYKKRLIAYSLGNFVGYRVFSLHGPKGLSYMLNVNLHQSGKFLSGKIIPLYLTSAGIPARDSRKRAIHLIRRLSQEDFPRSKLIITKDGLIK